MGGLESTLVDASKSLFDSLGWLGVVVAMAIETAGIPFPSEIIMPMAGWMIVAERDLGWQGVLLASFWGAVGNLIGSTIAHWIGGGGGTPLMRKHWKVISL